MREQLHESLEEKLGEGDYMPQCQFLAPLVEQAISEVVSSATTCMAWLKEVALRANDLGVDVRWVSPCGVPVNSQYRDYISEQVEVYVGGQRKRIRLAKATDVHNKRRSVSALAPNFIHSLDAAHLMMTVNLTTAGSLAMVHDSYATLACDVDELGVSLRMAFVALHTQPLLELFRNELTAHYTVPAAPALGGFDLTEVLDAEYFFA
jgi:DNA-directed RNA polymerase